MLAGTIVELADSLVDDFDVTELLTLLAARTVETLDVAAAGVMLVTDVGDLRVLASSQETAEVLQVQVTGGPSWESCTAGVQVVNHAVTPTDTPWPDFGARAFAAGFRSVHAVPMRHRAATLGSLSLFCTDGTRLDDSDVAVAQAMADVATMAVLHHRAAREARVVSEQLRRVLTSRIPIEQAKGIVAGRAGNGLQHAFERMCNHARNHDLRIIDVAHAIISGALPPRHLDDWHPSTPRPRADTP